MLKSLFFVIVCVLGAPLLHAADELPMPGGGAAALLGAKSSFLRVEQAYPLRATLDGGQLVFEWSVTPGYYLYRERMGFALREAGGTRKLDVPLPPGEPYEDAFLGKTEVYRGSLRVAVPLPEVATLLLELKSQGCADAGLCYPPRTQLFEIDTAAGTVLETAPPVPAAALPAAPAAAQPLAYILLLAALGGLILNLMPCVFPVLSLKVLSIAGNGGGEHGKAMHGVVYTAGVVLSFLAVAGLLLALRQAGAAIGWGFHLQSPVFVAALAYLFFVMGLAFSGVINLGAGLMGAGNSLAQRQGYTGTFFTGVLATVVASPCTAPFMGTALGFAMTQSVAVALLVFAALGVGMASPFLLLALAPGLLRRLPKPGAWMDSFKQLLAFPLYAAAVWLLWVLGKQSGVNGMAAVAGGFVLLALALWGWERARGSKRPWWLRATALGSLLLALLLLNSPLLAPQPTDKRAGIGDTWEAYSAERLATLRQAGKPVFINVTADWCITCLANEKVALGSAAVLEAFAARNITYLKGDWTNADPVLTRLLQQHGRSGVPLYLYYPPGAGAAPQILPQLLTPSIVLEAIEGKG